MKLLFDQNISYRLIRIIEDIFPDSKQVSQLNLENCTDSQIWDYARLNEYCIVTFDADFYDLGLVRGTPPKIIWFRMGNTSTKSLEKIIRENEILNKEFIENSDYDELICLEID